MKVCDFVSERCGFGAGVTFQTHNDREQLVEAREDANRVVLHLINRGEATERRLEGLVGELAAERGDKAFVSRGGLVETIGTHEKRGVAAEAFDVSS